MIRVFLLAVLLAVPALADMFPHVAVIGASTCGRIDGNVSPVFIAAGTCVDQTEAFVQQTVAATGALINLACVTSADPGSGKTLTVTGRSGACGSQTSASFTCTLTGGSGVPTCNSSTSQLAITAGQCWDLQIAASGALTTPVTVQCTLERPL